MNRILFEKQAGNYTLDPRDPGFDHVRGVLRMGVGDSFDVGVVNGPTGKATILSLRDDALKVAVEWKERPPLPPDIHLLIGMCRPATVRKILSTAPTLGIRGLHFVRSGRSDPSYARSGIWNDGEWRSRLLEGVEQAFDTFLPEVVVSDSLEEGIQQLPAAKHRLALDVYEGSQPLASVPLEREDSLVLAIGPERGWNEPDRVALRKGGFSLVSLNDRVLRVATAVVVGLTLVLAGMGIY